MMSRRFLHVATWVLLVITSCETGLTQVAIPEQTRPPRQPVPSLEELTSAVKELQQLYDSEYGRTTRSLGKQVLAKKLLETAAATQNEPVGKYAALVEARRLALDVGDVATTFKCIELLTAEYDLTPLAEKTAAIVLLGNAGSTTSTIRELTKELLPTLEEAVAVDDFRSANRIHSVAVDVARKRSDRSFSNRLDRVKAELDGLEQQLSEYRAAKETLDKDPRDPSAHRTIALYLGLRKDRWKEGEPHIRLAKDDMLQSLFARQCLPPTEPAEQDALADHWWDWAYLQKGIVRVQAQALAVSWYRVCQSELAGLARARADDRLNSPIPALTVRLAVGPAAPAVAVAAATAGASGPAGEPATQAPKSENLISRDRLAFARGPWNLHENQLTYNDSVRDGVVRIKDLTAEDFRIEIEATPSEVTRATRVVLGFQRANRGFVIELSELRSCVLTGDEVLQPIGKPKDEPVWKRGATNVVIYEVRGDTLTVTVNGDEFLTYKADALQNGAASNFTLEALGDWKISRFDFYPNP